jgi:hypothetical protein
MKRKLDKKDYNIYISRKKYKIWFYRLICIIWICHSEEFWFLNNFHERDALNKAFNWIKKQDCNAIINTKWWDKNIKECLDILNWN